MMRGGEKSGGVDEKIEEFVHVLHFIDETGTSGPGYGRSRYEQQWRQKFWQIFPSVCASLLAIPFGIMLGWPSIAYPYLLQETSVIPISLSQSAMIAGFFMIGISAATIFSANCQISPKCGIWSSILLTAAGWCLMWYSSSVHWLLGSRFTAGLGGGLAFIHVKAYIKDMCEPKLSAHLIKQLNFYGFFGTIIAFSIHIFLDFRRFSLISLIISIVIFFITIFLPSSPKDFIKANKIDDAVILLNYLRGKKDHTEEIKNIHHQLSTKRATLRNMLKDGAARTNLLKLVLMVFLQQFSGAPTSFVYCQIIFDESGCSFPEYCAVIYAIFFFTSNIYSVFYASNLNKKCTLIFSSCTSLLMLILQVLVLYFEINNQWPYASLFVMLLFVTFYSIGVGSISSTYITEWFPVKYHQTVSNIFVIVFYISALVATKTFQVLMESYTLYVGFFLFILADLLFLTFTLIFIKKENVGSSKRYLQTNAKSFLNAKHGNSTKS